MRTVTTGFLASLALASALSAGPQRAPVVRASGPDGLTGTWYVGVTFTGNVHTSALLSLVQTGSHIVGTGAIVSGGSGSVTGDLSGNTFAFSVAEAAPCSGSFTGSVTVSGDRRTFEGSISGSDCNGSHTADVSAVNQSVKGGAEPTSNVTGVWDGTLTVSGFHSEFSFTLVQDGSALTGTAVLPDGGGAVIGNVTGDDIQFTIYEVSPCPGSFIGTATVGTDGRTLTGAVSGSDCEGTAIATVTATKR